MNHFRQMAGGPYSIPGASFELRSRYSDHGHMVSPYEDCTEYFPCSGPPFPGGRSPFSGDIPRSMGPMGGMSGMNGLGYLPGYDSDMLVNSSVGQGSEDMIRRTNVSVQVANMSITPSTQYAQLQPKMTNEGRYPSDFRMAKTVEEVKCMDVSSLDRILQAYNLPTDLRSLRMSASDGIGPKVMRMAKLCTLFDFLGATQISEHERMRRRYRSEMLPMIAGRF